MCISIENNLRSSEQKFIQLGLIQDFQNLFYIKAFYIILIIFNTLRNVKASHFPT